MFIENNGQKFEPSGENSWRGNARNALYSVPRKNLFKCEKW